MDHIKKSVLYGLLFYIFSLSLYISYYFLFPERLRFLFTNTLIDSLKYKTPMFFMIGIPVFFVMIITSYIILSSRKEELKFKTPIKISTILLLLILIIWILYYVLLYFVGRSLGEGAMALSILAFYISFYAIISLIFSVLLSWIIYYSSEKASIVIIVILIFLLILGSFFIFYINGFCLIDDVRCNTQKAVVADDISICEKIGPKCYAEFAYRRNDEKICENVPTVSEMNRCYTELAKNKKEGDVCKLVKNSEEKLSCCLWAYEGKTIAGQGGLSALTSDQKAICGLE